VHGSNISPQHETVLSGGRINLAELISFVEGKAKLSSTATVCGAQAERTCRDMEMGGWRGRAGRPAGQRAASEAKKQTRLDLGSGRSAVRRSVGGRWPVSEGAFGLSGQAGGTRDSLGWALEGFSRRKLDDLERCQDGLLPNRKDGRTWDALGDSEIL
jgi:hypothetical protein